MQAPMNRPPGTLVLLRHAQSLWNLENRFSGWADMDLSEGGIAEAHRAGRLLRDHGLRFDRAFVSPLQRATPTLDIVRAELGPDNLPAERRPATESLEDTERRVVAYWRQAIVPHLERGETVLVVSHGNTLRALVKHLRGLSESEVERLEIPTGVPLVYEYRAPAIVKSYRPGLVQLLEA